jgi:pimeloyl-ACP methyl ester carboxylesterase
VFKSLVIGAAASAIGASSLVAQARCAAVGEQGIHACVHGDGEPIIVLAAGAGQDSRTWAPLVGPLAEYGTVVTFDRPGLGQSPEAAGPRTPTAITRELRHVLEVLDLPGPAIMVGHSMGGIHVLRYTELYPESVSGVLLLDAPPAGFEEQRISLLSLAEQEQRRESLAQARLRARAVVGRERDGATAESWDFTGFPESVPLIVTAADSQYFGELGSAAEHRGLWLDLTKRWLDLSARSELRIAAGSGHMIHRDRPELVVDQVRHLIAISEGAVEGQ